MIPGWRAPASPVSKRIVALFGVPNRIAYRETARVASPHGRERLGLADAFWHGLRCDIRFGLEIV
jgi:hypothetical protein